jgi:hypothetical protein
MLLLQNNNNSQFLEKTVGQQTVLVQYANSPIITSLIDSINNAIDPSVNLDNFWNHVWNINTATGFGLDIWGRIVDVSRTINLPESSYIGFSEGNWKAFGLAKLYRGQTVTTNYQLSDDAYRLMILSKALFNISRTTYSVYNKILMQLFKGRGRAYIGTSDNMQARLTFEFLLTDFEVAILQQSNVFMPPTGVNFEILDYTVSTTIGFAESGRAATFGYGTLFRDFR